MEYLCQVLWISLYMYFVYNTGSVDKGRTKAIVLFIICFLAAVPGVIFHMQYLSWVAITLMLVLYVLFYDDEPFNVQWKTAAVYGMWAVMLEFAEAMVPYIDGYMTTTALCMAAFFLLSWKRGYLKVFNGMLIFIVYFILIITGFFCSLKGDRLFTDQGTCLAVKLICFMVGLLLFILLEGTLKSYQSGFETSTREFQQKVLSNQYEEIKNIYMNMRGWRHDYHNHLQVIKAQMALEKYEEVSIYLDELEQDLDKVDTYVKSGNLMIDAILNSKLSMAQDRKIAINCKADLPAELPIADIDLCVILGNLLDNAIEACEKIEIDKRFLRVYIAVNKKQLYASIQNSAKEELNFNERNYITSKRGNHGLGMKRVKLLVDKYRGFLNLQNEPGIFASEVSIPLI